MPALLPTAVDYVPKVPFWHDAQLRDFERSAEADLFALFHEPRTGKSKIVVDTCCYQFRKRRIGGLLVIVWPSGGHIGWVTEAWPMNATVPWVGFVWDSSRAGTQAYRKAFEEFVMSRDFTVMAVNVEALISERCRDYILRFLQVRKLVMAVADESSSIADSDTRRTKIMLDIAAQPACVMRRILDGTPVDKKGPLDYYTQFGFLSYDILGYRNETEFQQHYAVIEQTGRTLYWREVRRLEAVAREQGYTDPRGWALEMAKRVEGFDEAIGRKRKLKPGRDYWTSLVKDESGLPLFRNVDELKRRIEPYVGRCTFRQAFPGAKDTIFVKAHFQLTPEQRRVYDEIDKEYRSVLQDGSEIVAAHQLTRLLRLQQVTSNYYPDGTSLALHEPCRGLGCEGCEDSGVVETEVPLRLIDPKRNPRMEALRDELRAGDPAIVWVRFVQDGKLAMAAAAEAGMSPVPYFGAMTTKQKLASRAAFQDDRTAGCIVCNWSRGSRAIRLDAARKHVAVSNQWSYRTRQQAEQRSEHGSKMGQAATVFVDIVAHNTVDDEKIIPALRAGMDVSAAILGDERRAWI